MANPIYDALVGIHRGNAKPFLHLQDGRVVSHAEFASLVGRIALVLRDNGVEAGDRVAVHAAKTPETLALFFGCAQIGAVFLPLNTAYTLEELRFFLGDAQPKLCVCAPEEEADIAALLQRRGRTLAISADSTGSFPDVIAKAEPLKDVADRGDDDLAALLYTSGTTGRSKGAMLTQNNLLSNARAWWLSGALRPTTC